MKNICLWTLVLMLPVCAFANDGKTTDGTPTATEESREGILTEVEESATASSEEINYAPKIHGTIRGKFEYQPEEDEIRFQVRSARVSFEGNVAKGASYKAEIDLSDEGSIKMLDAYVRLTPYRNFDFTIGQMRVPFTTDAHRSPHKQYFANRSFIAKQVGNVRDVGATLGYSFGKKVPVTLQAGLFNGSGLTEQKNYWTSSINYSAKAEIGLPAGFTAQLSVQKTHPDIVDIHMYDASLSFKSGRWMIEAEYLSKNYENNSFDSVNAFDGFVCYDIPLKKVFTKISLLARYDMMDDHSDGEADEDGVLPIDDYARKRITGGVTLSIAKPFTADIRINYEDYFYRDSGIPATSEKDKFVIELMVRF